MQIAGTGVTGKSFLRIADFGRVFEIQKAYACPASTFGKDSHNQTSVYLYSKFEN